MRLLLNIPKWLRELNRAHIRRVTCRHGFYIDQISERDKAGNVSAPCHRCKQVFTAPYGLALPGNLDGWSPEYLAKRSPDGKVQR